MVSQLDLESKCQGHSKNQKPMPLETKNIPPPKNLSRGSLSNWRDADADEDADICKNNMSTPPLGGVDIMMNDMYSKFEKSRLIQIGVLDH